MFFIFTAVFIIELSSKLDQNFKKGSLLRSVHHLIKISLTLQFFHDIFIIFYWQRMDRSTIKVASLNFSGINTSYFEYNDGSVLFQALNRNYKIIRDAQFRDMKKWIGAKLDKNYKSDRFTVLSGDQFPSELKDVLFSKEQFEKYWKITYQNAKENNKILEGYQASEEEVQDVLKMDYSFYRAVIMSLYEINSLKEFEQRLSSLNPIILKEFLLNFKKLPRFQKHTKRKAVEIFYQTMDLMFLQEADVVEWKMKKGFEMVQGSSCFIFFRTEVVGNIDPEETKRWKQKLNINKDSVSVVTDKRYLLVSSHFKSTSPGYLDQEKQFFDVLHNCHNFYANKNQKLKIICGIDANHFISSENQPLPGVEIYPSKKQDFTTNKKRSYIQAQLKKADLAVNEVKDHIITNFSIKEKYISLIDGKQNRNELLPNDEHPFDHFAVTAYLKQKSQ